MEYHKLLELILLNTGLSYFSVKYLKRYYRINVNMPLLFLSGVLWEYILINIFDDNMVFVVMLLSTILYIGATIDRRYGILPDIGWLSLVFLYVIYVLGSYFQFDYIEYLENVLWQIAMGGIKFFLLGLAFYLLRLISNGGLGWGDIKWAAAMAPWINFGYLQYAFFLPFVIGTIFIIIKLIGGGDAPHKIPFGPYLNSGLLLAMLLPYILQRGFYEKCWLRLF